MFTSSFLDIPFASNSTSADFMIQSPLMSVENYNRLVLDFTAYRNRLHAKAEEHLQNDVKWEQGTDSNQG